MKKVILLISLVFSINLYAQWENFNSENIAQIVSDHVRTVVVDENGAAWFGTADGLIVYDGQFWTRYSVEDESPADNSINQLEYMPGDNSLLMATDNGSSIASLEGEFSIEESYTPDNSGIYAAMVYSAHVNPNDIKIFGTSAGVSVFNNSAWAAIQGMSVIDSINMADNPVRSVNSHGENTFISSDGKGIYLTSNEVDGISFVTNWVFPYNIPTSDNVKTAFVDVEGNQWYGTDAGAVFHTGITAQGSWSDPITTANGLPDNQVNAIIEDSYGNIWFGTENGLAVKKTDESWSVYSENDGLINNRITDLAETEDHKIWITTHNGISLFTPSWVSNVELNTSTYFNLNVHPNPATEGVWIKYKLPSSGPLRISVYDISGKRLNILKDEFGVTGTHEYFWDLKNEKGHSVDRGIYFIRLQSGTLTSTRKVVVVQ